MKQRKLKVNIEFNTLKLYFIPRVFTFLPTIAILLYTDIVVI